MVPRVFAYGGRALRGLSLSEAMRTPGRFALTHPREFDTIPRGAIGAIDMEFS